MKITILTLFPEMFSSPFSYSILKHAQKKKLVSIRYIQIRDFGVGRHRIVDDKPYGGGHGMILRVDVLHKAIESAKDRSLKKGEEIVALMDAHGKRFDHEKAEKFSTLKHLILICGHYEGVDERIKRFVDAEISIGDFVVTGGELPAMIVVDSVVRLIKGVLKEGVTVSESFSIQDKTQKKPTNYLEYPQYTRPNVHQKLKVPQILLSGNHKEIQKWKENHLLKAP